MWKTQCKHVHLDHIEVVLDYIADPSMWPKQQGSIGQSSGAFPALACPGTSRSQNDIWPARRHLSSVPVSVGRRMANMVAKIRDQMWKEVFRVCLTLCESSLSEQWRGGSCQLL